MPDTYLIEIRLAATRWRVKRTIAAIAHDFRIKKHMELHPHVTLFGPLVLNDGVSGQKLLDAVEHVAQHYGPLPFLIEGWEKRDGMYGGVLAFPVKPSESLKKITHEIADAVSPLAQSLNVWDKYPDKKWFHVTIANHLKPEHAERFYRQLVLWVDTPGPSVPIPEGFLEDLMFRMKSIFKKEYRPVARPPVLDDCGLRVTVMHGQEILGEYDLFLHAWVHGGRSREDPSWQATLLAHRNTAGFERAAKESVKSGSVWVISDLHLGHANIIRYCSRPFLHTGVQEMDRVLIDNWNRTIAPGDRVYFLGDLRYGPAAALASEYIRMLNGDIIFIRGNHDDESLPAKPYAAAEYQGMKFLFVHDPADAPENFDGWIVHGHHHNNDLKNFPFIHFAKRRVNASVEVIGYVPVSLGEIHSLIIGSGRFRTSPSVLLRYPYVH